MTIMDTMGELAVALHAFDALEPSKAKLKADGLKQYEYSDIGLGWVIHAGYEVVEWDEGQPVIEVRTLELNTGNHIFPLALRDIPGADLTAIEQLIADEEEAAAYEAAKSLARDDGDYGEYCLNAQRDKLAALEPDEGVK